MDLFAGCGGVTLGFKKTCRFQPVFAIELDVDAAATYERNFGRHIARNADGNPLAIEDVPRFPPVDVIIGGPPCQGFSPLNMLGVRLERRGLWREYLRALDEAKPRAFVMENVPELLRSAEYAAFKAEAEELGYEIDQDILNAADFGVPQKRRRAIVIGVMGAKPRFPQPKFRSPHDKQAPGRPWRTFRYAVRGLPRTPTNTNWHN